MHEDCCAVIDFGIFVIQIFGEMESRNLGIQLGRYTFTKVMKQLDGVHNLQDFEIIRDANEDLT